jgi:hypothetical protein
LILNTSLNNNKQQQTTTNNNKQQQATTSNNKETGGWFIEPAFPTLALFIIHFIP